MKATLSLSFMLLFGAAFAQPSYNGLMGYYFFNTTTNDQSGNLYHATLQGGATISGGTLNLGYNTSDYLTIPAAVLNGHQAFSVSFRIKFNSLNVSGGSATNHILSGDIAGNEENFGLSYQKSVNMWRFAFNQSLYDFTDSQIQAGVWYCFVLQRSANGLISAYRDNVQLSETYSDSSTTNVSSLLIGQETDCLGGCFTLNQCANAQMDNLIMYDRALIAGEVDLLCDSVLIVNSIQSHEIQLYPNPTNNNVTLHYSGDIETLQGVTIGVFNVLGEQILTLPFNQKQQQIELLPYGSAGLYFVHITDSEGNNIYSEKIVVE